MNVSEIVSSGGVKYSVRGHCDPRFEPVGRAFVANFERGEECGAAACVEVDGECVLDLWGGYSDAARTAQWRADTLVNMMSVSKGPTATCVHMLMDRGELDIDAPVAAYWPQFAAAGKAALPVRYLLDHRAGLPIVTAPLRAGDLYDWTKITSALAEQEPMWPPGTQAGYHILTQGFLLGELVRRVSGESLGEFFRAHVAKPLGLDFHIGLDEAEFARTAQFIPAVEGTIFEANRTDPQSLKARAWDQCQLGEDFNSPEWRRAEIPGANGHGNARAVARLYSALVRGGELDGVRLMSERQVRLMSSESHHQTEVVLGRKYHQALGVLRNSPPFIYMGPNPNTFGHHGVGGSIGCGDPDRRIAFSYACNQMHARLDNGPRGGSLLDAVYRSLDPGFNPTWKF